MEMCVEEMRDGMEEAFYMATAAILSSSVIQPISSLSEMPTLLFCLSGHQTGFFL